MNSQRFTGIYRIFNKRVSVCSEIEIIYFATACFEIKTQLVFFICSFDLFLPFAGRNRKIVKRNILFIKL